MSHFENNVLLFEPAPSPETHNYGAFMVAIELSDFEIEEEKLRKLYDQARAQGNKKKKKEYKEKISELNRARKAAQRQNKKSGNF